MAHNNTKLMDEQHQRWCAVCHDVGFSVRVAVAPQADLVMHVTCHACAQIVAEIQERREFLEVMQSAGKAGEYEAKTKGEIAQRLKELEKLGFDVKSSRPQKGKDPNRVHIG